MSTADSGQDVWTRLRAYCEVLQSLENLPTTYDEAHEMGLKHAFPFRPDGRRPRPRILERPPATEEQLRATEGRLGFPLPADLRCLYSKVANGGCNLGPLDVFHGAIGGCGESADTETGGRTIEELVSRSGWRLHPRIEDALLRHPGYYVVADSLPDQFLWIGGDFQISVYLDPQTGYIYDSEYWGEIPNAPDDGALSLHLVSLVFAAPSLSVEIERWLDQTPGVWPGGDHLRAEMVETDDLPDPDVVWRGLYRFGPDWEPRPAEEEDLERLSPFLLNG